MSDRIVEFSLLMIIITLPTKRQNNELPIRTVCTANSQFHITFTHTHTHTHINIYSYIIHIFRSRLMAIY